MSETNFDDELTFIFNDPPPIKPNPDFFDDGDSETDFIGENTEEEDEYYAERERRKKQIRKTKAKRKSTFLNMAVNVFKINGNTPLKVRDIWNNRGNGFKTTGKTPWGTLSKQLHDDWRSENPTFVKYGRKFCLI